MSIIIRLQNLPWAADSSDIRRYFAGLSIPEGGVHIVGGEMGDAFIAFSTDEDARLAMAKDGGKIHEMQIKLLLSSRQEMARVIERARQQNLALQSAQIVPPMQPPPFPNIQQLQQPIRIPTPVENDRRRGRSPTPPRRRSRERMDSRDRRRSPDSRRSFSSKKDRSRSPPRSSRGSSRDRDSRDRRSDRSGRDDRRYSKEDSSRYSDNRYSERNRYPDDDHNSRSQVFPDASRESNNLPYHNYPDQKTGPSSNNYSFNNSLNPATSKDYNVASAVSNNAYLYNNPSTTAPSKDYSGSNPSSNNYPYATPTVPYSYATPNVPSASKAYETPFYNSSASELNSALNSVDQSFGLDKVNIAAVLNQASSASPSSYMQKTNSYDTLPYQQPFTTEKAQVSSTTENQSSDRKRRSRFEPEPTPPLQPPSFVLPEVFQKLGVKLEPQISKNTIEEQSLTKSYQPVSNMPRAEWSQQSAPVKNENWNNLSNTIQRLQSSVSDSKTGNSSSMAIPMDLDPPEESPVIYSHSIDEPVASNNQVPERNNLPIRSNDGPLSTPPRVTTAPNKKQWHGPITQTMELRRMPYDTTMEDILCLFQNVPLNPSNVCIQGNNHRVDRVFIQFSSTRDFNEAMNSQPVYIKNSHIELIPCPASAFESAVASQSKPRPRYVPREADLILQLKGLPFQCSEQDIVRFFSDLRILDMFLERQADGRCSGIGYVKFASMTDMKNGLLLNGKTIAHRYITIRIGNKEMLEFARDESISYKDVPSREPAQKEPPRREPIHREQEPSRRQSMQRESPQREPSPQKSMQREPLLKAPIQRETTLKDQTQREPQMRETSIKEPPMRERSSREPISEPPYREPPLRTQPNREPSRREHAIRQSSMREPPPHEPQMSPKKFGGRRPEFNDSLPTRDVPEPPISTPVRGNFCIGIRGLPKSVTSANLGQFFKEMDVTGLGIHIIVDNNIPTGQAFVEVATQREVDIAVSKNGTPFHNCRLNMYSLSIQKLDEILTMGVLPPDSGPLLGKPSDDSRPPRRPLLAQAPILDNFRDGPRRDYPSNERMRPPGPMRGGRPMRPPIGDRHIRPPMGRMRGPRPEGRRSPDRGPPGFGAPGCVVAVNNLHFNAGLEELLKFFKGFRITKDNIMRRYNEHQQPTGEARVCFENPKEALRAVRELDTKQIMGRSLHLLVL